MMTFSARIKNISIICGAFLVILGIVWLIIAHKAFVAGLMLGTATGLINSLYTAYKINQLGSMATSGSQRRFATIGSGTRFATALLAAFVAIKYPEYVNLAGTIIGLMFVPLATLAEGVIALKKQNTSEERGEK